MKTLLFLAEVHNSRVVLIKFRFKNTTKIGYAIVDSKDNELITFEPCNYSNGGKWIVTNRCAGGQKDMPILTYIKSLKQARSYRYDIREGFTGYKFTVNN